MSHHQDQSNAVAAATPCSACENTTTQDGVVIDPKLAALLPENIFFIDSKRVASIMQEMGYESHLDLLHEILKLAARRARPPISSFYVGTVGLSQAGHIYCGGNVEFDGLSLNDSIHGEQCLIARLVNADEKGMVCFSVNAPPCGHCRQFINELDVRELKIAITGKGTFSLDQLLPFSFGPNDLGNATRLLQHPSYAITTLQQLPHADAGAEAQLVEIAVKAASRAYSPYTECPSGVALRLKDGSTYRGSYIENAAYNPSLPPLQSALTGMVGDERQWTEIEACVLVERKGALISQEGITRRLLASIAPQASFHVYNIDKCVKETS